MYEQKKKLGYIQTVPIQLLYIHWIPVMRESCQKKKNPMPKLQNTKQSYDDDHE